MSKIKVTAQQRANAIEARDVLWPSVNPDTVVRGLRTWYENESTHCGTHACFGGWCALHPPFKNQGLCRTPGRVTYRDPVTGLTGPTSGDDILFGDCEMFDARGGHPADHQIPYIMSREVTDHELVTHRLNWLIENSEVIGDVE